jgi:hypothetical protein
MTIKFKGIIYSHLYVKALLFLSDKNTCIMSPNIIISKKLVSFAVIFHKRNVKDLQVSSIYDTPNEP